MAKDILVEEGRKMKGVTDSGDTESIELLKPMMDDKGVLMHANDLADADFDVAVDVGPSSSSKKQSTVRTLTNMMAMTQDPETLMVITAMTMLNMEGEGMKDTHQFFRNKLLHMGAVKPTDEEAQQLQAEQQNPQPDPQAQFLQASAEQAAAATTKSRSDTLLNVAKAKKTDAETAQTIATMTQDQQTHVIDAVQQLHDMQAPGETPAGQ